MDSVKEIIRRQSLKIRRSRHSSPHNGKPELSEADLDYIAKHTSITKEDVQEK